MYSGSKRVTDRGLCQQRLQFADDHDPRDAVAKKNTTTTKKHARMCNYLAEHFVSSCECFIPPF